MHETSPTDRLACAILIGEQALNKAVDLLVEAGFATEHIRVLWQHGQDDSSEQDHGTSEVHDPDADSDSGASRSEPYAEHADQDEHEGEDEPDDLSEAAVVLRTGVRRMLPIGAALGAMATGVMVWFDGNPTQPLLPQLMTAAATGAFLGGMAGLVMGLGHWQHVIDLPAHYTGDPPTLIAVDVVAQGREPEALSAFAGAGARDITVCSSHEAEQLVRALSSRAVERA